MARVQTNPTTADEVVVEPAIDRDRVDPDYLGPEARDTRDAREAVVADADTRNEVIAREKEEFGGMKFGSAFFGWLTAVGMGVLLTAIVLAIGTAAGYGGDDAVVRVRDLGIVGAVIVAVVMFVAYLAGGYVAGRMARFSGARQGFAVWLWALIAAVVVALLGVIVGAQFDVLSTLDAFPRIPVAEDDLTVAGIVTAAALALITLVGAVFGGMAGMRYHRRVDRAGVLAD